MTNAPVSPNSIGFLSVLRNPQFFKLWIGQVVSYIGDRFTQMALLGLIIGTAHTGHEMSRITFFSLLPAFLFGHIAGAWIDRVSRRRILIVTDLLRALLVFAIPLGMGLGLSHHVLMYLLIFLVGSCTAFFTPAKLALIPDLVQRNELQVANALVSGTGTIATLIGTYVAGLVVERLGAMTSFTINGVTYLISCLAVWMISVRERPLQSRVAQDLFTQWIGDFRTAYQYLWQHLYAQRLIWLSVVLSFLSSFFYITLITLGVEHFRLKTEAVGFFLALLGGGMVLGAFLAAYLVKWLKETFVLVLAFVGVAAASLAFGGVNSYRSAAVVLLALGAANEVIVVTLDTLLQKITPNRFRGKVFGFRGALTTGMFLAALLLVGRALTTISPFDMLRLLAVVSLVVAFAILLIGERFAYWVFRTALKAVLRLFFRLQIEGAHYLQRPGPVILAGNHTGLLDSPLVIASFRRPIRFLVAEQVFSWPLIGWIVRRAGVIPVRPGKGGVAYREALERLKRSEAIGIFPEGKLTTDGSIAPFHKGAARLHLENGAPIVPFVIQGGFEAWQWRKKFPTPRKVVIQFGVPIEHKQQASDALTAELEHTIRFMKEALERRERRLADEAFASSVLTLLESKSDRFAAQPALCIKQGRKWVELSYGELSRRARRLAAYLIERGFAQGDRLAVLSESRPEWGIALFAGVRAGAVVVPLDVKLSEAELVSILTDCAPRVLCVSAHYKAVARTLRSRIPSLELVAVLEEGGGEDGMPSIDQLVPREMLPSRERKLDETAVIIYTSGTTGSPKGVMTTFGNLIFQVRAFERLVEIGPSDRFLSILPLNHLLELTGGFLGVLHTGGTICYTNSLHPQEIANAMHEHRITAMIGVPLFFRALKTSIENGLRHLNGLGRFFLRWANALSHVVRWSPLRRLLFFPIHRKFGGRLRAFVSGAAPLDDGVARFFHRLGLPILQGYGLTETSPVISVNTLKANRIGSVGKPLEGTEVKIDVKEERDSEGEILTRGPHVMKGYYKRPDLTEEVVDRDGWFHTGDLGRIDEDGFLYITGRIKNLIVLGGGKKVHPEEVEAVLSRSAAVKEVCVVGWVSTDGAKAGTEEVCAVIVPSDTLMRHHQGHIGLVEQAIRDEVNHLSKDLASYKRPSRLVIRSEELPKTATRKIKRPLVVQWLDSQKA
jgi:long-chain acyl-CoA synthetase